MTEERTPKTHRSIVRNHSPYCESTGPIVQEGFVAARIRALQGFSNEAQIVTRSHSPLTPCPPHRLLVHRSPNPPKPSSALEQALIGRNWPRTGMVKRFRTQILSKDQRNLVNTPEGSARLSDIAPFCHPQEQKATMRPTTSIRSYSEGRDAETPSPDLFEGGVLAPHAKLSQDDHADDVLAKNLTPSEQSILSPHAIQADLVEPRAAWTCLSLTEDHNDDYIHEQSLKPQRSIADKLGSMVERGWVGGNTFGKVHSDKDFASHITDPKSLICDTGLDSQSDHSLDEKARLKKMPSYSGSLSVSTAGTRSESQHSTAQDTPLYVSQENPRTLMNRSSQKRSTPQGKRSPAVNPPQRSSSDFSVDYLKTEVATALGKPRAQTLHHLGRSTKNEIQTQPKSSSVEDEQYESSAALTKITGSRRSSSNTKGSTRSASRSTSFFKKFPWYKVALVDKQPAVQSSSKGGYCNDRTSRAIRAAPHDSTLTRSEPSRGVSKSDTLVECGHGESESSPKTRSPPHQSLFDQQAVDAKTSCSKACSPPFRRLVTSPQETSEHQILEQIQRASERSQDCYAPNVNVGEERLPRMSHPVATDVIGHAHGPKSRGLSSMQPRFPSQSGFMEASFESPISSDVIQSLQPQGLGVKEHSRMQTYTSSHASSTKPHAGNSMERGSSGFETPRAERRITTSSSLSHRPRSEVANLTPTRLDTRSGSSPTSIHRSNQSRSVHQEAEGEGKGIKKIQVTVTFDEAEDLVIEATVKKSNRQGQWRSMA